MPSPPRPLARKRDFALIGAVLLLAAALWFWRVGPGEGAGELYAVISVDGGIQRVLPLDELPKRLTLRPLRPADFEGRDGALRFVGVDCPDHLCEGMGWQKKLGDTAVCLPNKTVLEIMDQEGLHARGWADKP